MPISTCSAGSSALFGGYYALNPAKAEGPLPLLQFVIYTLGVVIMAISLYLLLSGNPAMAPIVAVSSLITFAGVLLFVWIVWLPAGSRARVTPQAAP